MRKQGQQLYWRILIALAAALAAAFALGQRVIPLGEIGFVVIRLLKVLATPLVFFAILDAFLRMPISGKKALRLVLLSALNAFMAIALGLLVSNTLKSGVRWRGHTNALTDNIASVSASAPPLATSAKDVQTGLSHYVPDSLIEPFAKNNLVAIVLIAVLLGAALRKVKTQNLPESLLHKRFPQDAASKDQALIPITRKETPTTPYFEEQSEPGPSSSDRRTRENRRGTGSDIAHGIQVIENAVRAGLRVWMQMLDWIINLIPFAVFGIVASVVAKTGLHMVGILFSFLGTILLGLFLHTAVYYAFLLRFFGKISLRRFYTGALDSIMTALSCGSSIATLPITLRCLTDKLGVSEESARLAACVGTNLNHDGIILYEASAAVFVAQAFNYPLTFTHQVSIALTSIVAGVGIAGVPEAGLITLPLVLSAAHLPEAAIATVIPLLLPLDWIIGRCRAATNVVSDMTVAVMLDASDPSLKTKRISGD